MKTTVNIFRTLLLAVLTLTFGACGEDSLLSELGLDGQTTTKAEEAGVWQGDIAESFAGGSGTAEAPYLIANGAQLKRFAAIVNGTDNMEQNTAICGKLTTDIVLNDISNWETWDETTTGLNSWTPIGSSANQFVGTLDGDGHSVSGIYINSEADDQGLVGNLGEGGTLQNLGVKASYIKGGYSVGGLCGWNYFGNVTNCYNAGSVTGTGSYVGGVCGMNDGTVTNCYNSGTVAGSSQVGGVCGLNYATVTNCYNSGTVAGSSQVGGVCGLNYATVTNCYNAGNVTGTGDHVGGVCGLNYDTVTNCYYLTGKAAGGIGYGSGDATEKTETEFQSGAVAWLLSTGENGEIWGQNLTFAPKDSYPVLGGLKVVQSGEGYANELNQNSDGFYLISTADELRLFASMVNSGQTSINGRLTADIELNNTTGWENWGSNAPANSWTPIGDSDSTPFTGTLDGDGHSVSGIYISAVTDYQGLVGYLGGGTLQDLGVKASYIEGGMNVGGLCGRNEDGTVTNCYNSGSVTGTMSGVGGLCGQNQGTVSNCYNSGSVTGTGDYVGGVCGNNNATVTNCYNTGSVTGDSGVGGMCGLNEMGTNMSNCYNSGSVTGDSGVGGVCGSNLYSNVTNCYNTGNVTGTGDHVGGLCGYNYSGTVTNCYNTGNMSGSNYVGGVCGDNNYGTVNNCYYLDTCGASGKGTSMTEAQFKSGEVASLLGEDWGQTIGTDDYPVPTSDASKKVYAYTMYQGQSTETGYANNNGSIDLDLTSHPNTIAVFEASGTFAGTNIVVKDGDNSYTCAELVLTDGEDFYTPVKFTATKATYTRSPKVWATNDGSGSGWETLCLPFSGTLYAGEEAKEPVDLESNNGAYWLRSLTEFETPNTLIFASPATAADSKIKAGMPYIIALPGTSFGSESLEGQTISVRGTNVTVTNEAQSVAAGSMFAFTGTFATKVGDALSYQLNSENGTSGAGNLFVLDTNKLAPFRCRIDVTDLNIGGASTRSASGLPKELRIGQ